MSPGRREKVVVLGMMSTMPVPGVVWQTVHYLLGLDLLGFDAYYVEAHARTPSMLMANPSQDSAAIAAGFISSVMHRFGFDRRWAFDARHSDESCYGLSRAELTRLYRDAACILNLHGGTEPLAEHSNSRRLVYLETDPVTLQLELATGHQPTEDFLAAHSAFFTFAENWGKQDCLLPLSEHFRFQPTRQPVVVDLWATEGPSDGAVYTTVGNWDQQWRDVVFDGELYRWSKKHEFVRFLDVPQRSGLPFELALSSCPDADRAMLRRHGWQLRNGFGASTAIDEYRAYLRRSRGEFTVAKDQNVRFRTGWFSDRSASYLVAGRPVVTQDTGFGSVLPTGEGLFSFSTIEEAVDAVAAIESDYGRHSRAARSIGREWFSHDAVLRPLLEFVGLTVTGMARPGRRATDGDLPVRPADGSILAVDLVIEPTGKNPLVLPEATVSRISSTAVPATLESRAHPEPFASVVVVTRDNLILTRLCLESVLVNTDGPAFELVVVDNGSSHETLQYLTELERRNDQMVLVRENENLGFPRGVNAGLAKARGSVLVILNNDTIVPPGWLAGLASHLADQAIGMVGPVTNEAPNESRISTSYRTYGEMLAFAGRRRCDGTQRDVAMLTMFCVAMRREVFAEVGPLDERFGVGMFEDDDYAVRVHAAGYRTVCAEDVFVHHFGGGSLGALVPTGERQRLFDRNRALFEGKWGICWTPHAGREDSLYARLRDEIRTLIDATVPAGSTVSVVSRGDEGLTDLAGIEARHFPEGADGSYAGYYPVDSEQAVEWMRESRRRGCTHLVVPATSAWWLDHYGGLRSYLEDHAERCSDHFAPCAIFRFADLTGEAIPSSSEDPRQPVSSGKRGVDR
jgi:GT2 family glycosyltransferase